MPQFRLYAHGQPQTALPFTEFVALMASMTALVALSIDAMLPALAEIANDLGAQRANDSQLVISLIFLGLAIGQIFYGPLSDSIGRKPAIYLGFALFSVGCLLGLFAVDFRMMLIGRFLQGFGVAGPRGVSIALVRDQYEGRAMARVMSFVMTVFILVPIVAPMLGQALVLVVHWRAIFALYLLLVLIIGGWFLLRQPETLVEARRTPFHLGRILAAFREVFVNRIALGYTIMAGLVSGGFVGYLNSAQQIFQEEYGLGARFPFYFAALALALGTASFLNARLVMRFGMRTLSRWALFLLSALSLLFLFVALARGGNPTLWLLMSYFMVAFFAVGILFGNLNARAMVPLGHIAGVGAAVVGALSTLISALLGALIGQSYNGTVLPLVGGFALFGLLALGVMWWAERGQLAVEEA
ncbi:MAG: multidrug effflux MFS transporter [Caldilineaceae bacterium]